MATQFSFYCLVNPILKIVATNASLQIQDVAYLVSQNSFREVIVQVDELQIPQKVLGDQCYCPDLLIKKVLYKLQNKSSKEMLYEAKLNGKTFKFRFIYNKLSLFEPIDDRTQYYGSTLKLRGIGFYDKE